MFQRSIKEVFSFISGRFLKKCIEYIRKFFVHFLGDFKIFVKVIYFRVILWLISCSPPDNQGDITYMHFCNIIFFWHHDIQVPLQGVPNRMKYKIAHTVEWNFGSELLTLKGNHSPTFHWPEAACLSRVSSCNSRPLVSDTLGRKYLSVLSVYRASLLWLFLRVLWSFDIKDMLHWQESS